MTCVSQSGQASYVSLFKKGFSKTISNDMGVPVLFSSLCVGSKIMHLLFKIYVVNGLA